MKTKSPTKKQIAEAHAAVQDLIMRRRDVDRRLYQANKKRIQLLNALVIAEPGTLKY